MKLTLLALGTRGDIQPFVALGRGLQADGHTVTVCAPSTFRKMAEAHDLTYADMTDEIVRMTQTEAGRRAVGEAGNLPGLFKHWIQLARRVRPLQRQVLEEEWAAAQDADLVVCHPKALCASSLAERLDIPVVMATPAPALVATGAFPCPVLPPLSLPHPALQAAYNRLSYSIVRLMTAGTMGVVNEWREETLGLAPLPRFADPLVRADGRPIPVLHFFSRHVCPPPQDWPEHAHVTGYWFLEQDGSWEPPQDLVHFLQEGTPPVYIGFGSISGKDPGRTTRIVLEALETAGERGLLATGWGGMQAAELPENVYMIDAAPHDWLFPRVAAVAHHGGAGTTAAGLRAGRPSILCPFFGDQPFWGRCVTALGVGPQALPQRMLTSRDLASAIGRATGDLEMKQRAAELGAKIRAENGVAQAVAFLETYAASY